MAVILVDVRGRARGALTRPQRERLRRRLGRAMAAAGCARAEVSLSLVGDREIRALNRDYRGSDQATDVLSFSQREGQVGVPGGGALLGDVVISIETARRQAAAAGRAIDAELLHLAVHGLAHLLGLDHATVRQERVMFAFEARLREQSLGRGAVRPVGGLPVG